MSDLISIGPMLQIRKLTDGDLNFCAALVEQAGWNQVNRDWYRVMTLDPEGCFLVESNHRRAATIIFTRFDDIAWISMVLVDKNYRGQGIGTRMFGYVFNKLRETGVGTIRLDATAMGVHLYKKYGFQEEYQLIRLVCHKVTAKGKARAPKHSLESIKQMGQLDHKVTGTDRLKLIEQLDKEDGGNMEMSSHSEGDVSGYVAIRSGRIACQIGPCIAEDPDSGLVLLSRAFESVFGQKVIIDIPVNNEVALQWAKDHDFIEQRRFIRMYAGGKIQDQPSKIFASFGPEKG